MILQFETLIKSHNILEHILVIKILNEKIVILLITLSLYMKYQMDPVTFMWFISTYLVPENNFYFEHFSPRHHPVWDQSGSDSQTGWIHHCFEVWPF